VLRSTLPPAGVTWLRFAPAPCRIGQSRKHSRSFALTVDLRGPHVIAKPRMGTSLADNRHHDCTLAPSNVALEMKDLLPGTQHEFAAGDGRRERRSKKRGLQMRVAVPVMPRLFVAVATAGRNELVQDGRQVVLKPRLKFNGAQGSRTPHIEDVDGAALDSRGTYDFGNLPGKIVHVTVTLRRDLNLLLISHGLVTHPSTVLLRSLQPVRITHFPPALATPWKWQIVNIEHSTPGLPLHISTRSVISYVARCGIRARRYLHS